MDCSDWLTSLRSEQNTPHDPSPLLPQHEEKRIGRWIFIQNYDLKLTEILQILFQKVLILEQKGPNLDRVKILRKIFFIILKWWLKSQRLSIVLSFVYFKQYSVLHNLYLGVYWNHAKLEICE